MINKDNDVLYFSDECPLLPYMTLFDTTDLFPNNDELAALTKRVEQLHIDINRQNLKVELKKLTNRNRVKTSAPRNHPIHRVVVQIKRDHNIMKEQLGALQNVYASEIARLEVMTHCFLSKIHQILISIVPYMTMSPGEHHKVA